eukprot:GILJ01013266.1.p1 GENE.GILJ01013266.1~~GILJ01013266.1.p1  ORF type:complete len:285 (-),score=28.94 GILJ01013266.1:71-925(-)
MAIECELVGDAFGNFLQLFLAVSSFTVLLVKRQTELPRRPWKIFGLDASKQAVGACLAHLCNLLLATLLSSNGSNPCVWYYVNIFMDCSLGVLLAFLLHSTIEDRALRKGYFAFRSGDYGPLEALNYNHWWVQVGTWCLVIVVSKLALLLIMLIFADAFVAVGELSLSPFLPYPRLLLFVVMVLVPLLLNSVQFCLQDSFLKRRKTLDESRTSLFSLEDRHSRILEIHYAKKAKDLPRRSIPVTVTDSEGPQPVTIACQDPAVAVTTTVENGEADADPDSDTWV